MATRLPHFPRLTWLAPFSLLAGCTGIPEGSQPVTDFELEPYLGQWYEIARRPHRFEEGLICVTATYEHHPEGDVRGINHGYDIEKASRDVAEGQAHFTAEPPVNRLKVNFFSPPSMAATTSSSSNKTIAMP